VVYLRDYRGRLSSLASHFAKESVSTDYTDYIAKNADQLSSLTVILEIATRVMARLFAPGWVYLCNLRNLRMVFMKAWFPKMCAASHFAGDDA